MYHVVHNTCIMHGKDIKTRYIGSTSILRLRKDWHSIRLHRMQSSFKGHFQLIVFQKLSDWRLEKSCRKSIHVTSTSAKGLIEARMEKIIGFGSCSTNRKVKLLDNQKENLLDKHFFQPTQPIPNPIRERSGRLDNMQDGRNTSRSQEINLNSCSEELSSSWKNGATCGYSQYGWCERQLSSTFSAWKRYGQRWRWKTS